MGQGAAGIPAPIIVEADEVSRACVGRRLAGTALSSLSPPLQLKLEEIAHG